MVGSIQPDDGRGEPGSLPTRRKLNSCNPHVRCELEERIVISTRWEAAVAVDRRGKGDSPKFPARRGAWELGPFLKKGGTVTTPVEGDVEHCITGSDRGCFRPLRRQLELPAVAFFSFGRAVYDDMRRGEHKPTWDLWFKSLAEHPSEVWNGSKRWGNGSPVPGRRATRWW